MTQPVTMGIEMVIEDRGGEKHVLLSRDGDHIVTALTTSPKGHEIDITLPHGSEAWERAVRRAERGAAFL